jgi:hypothetical protein
VGVYLRNYGNFFKETMVAGRRNIPDLAAE